jgi:response regulator of citrate/malate metabolism
MEHPSIVLLDNNLSDGSGLDVLKEHPNSFRKSCVIMISADARPEIRKTRSEKESASFFKSLSPSGQ